MNIPVYYVCKRCEGQFPKKDYNFKAELCTTCDDLIKREQSIRDAAPELLEAVKTLASMASDFPNELSNKHPDVIEAFKAINKAEGLS